VDLVKSHFGGTRPRMKWLVRYNLICIRWFESYQAFRQTLHRLIYVFTLQSVLQSVI
jgi:hypothetical protein